MALPDLFQAEPLVQQTLLELQGMASAMELDEVVMKLVGPIRAVGETNEDANRLENLKELTALVDRLLYLIRISSHDATRTEASIKAIGMHAREFLRNVRQT